MFDASGVDGNRLLVSLWGKIEVGHLGVQVVVSVVHWGDDVGFWLGDGGGGGVCAAVGLVVGDGCGDRVHGGRGVGSSVNGGVSVGAAVATVGTRATLLLEVDRMTCVSDSLIGSTSGCQGSLGIGLVDTLVSVMKG